MTADFRYRGTELDLFATATNWKRYLARSLRPYISGRVLEVGAGIGGTTAALCTGREARWVCLEPDAELAAQLEARRARGDLPGNCAVRSGGLADLGGEDGDFDTIIYIDVLEHIENDAAELAAAAARLDVRGRLVVLSPAFQWLFSEFDAAIGHFRRYSKRQLLALTPAGLRPEAAFYLDSVGMLASMANRLLLSSAAPSLAQVRLWDRIMVPASTIADRVVARKFGRSIVTVWYRA